MRRGGAIGQIALVLLVAVAAIAAGTFLRGLVDQANGPSPAPTVLASAPVTQPSTSPAPSP